MEMKKFEIDILRNSSQIFLGVLSSDFKALGVQKDAFDTGVMIVIVQYMGLPSHNL